MKQNDSIIYDIINNNSEKYPHKHLDEKIVSINTTTIQPEKTPDKKFTYVDIESVENGTGKINYNKKILGASAPLRARRIAKAGSTIISTVRPNLKAFAFVEEEIEDCVYSTGFAIFESVDENYLLNKWLYYNFMYSSNLMEQMVSAMPKGQYPSINNDDIRNFAIPIPPIDKQKELVAKIELLEQEIQNSETELKKVEEQKKAILEKYL